jgi:hypothetical protein
MDRSEHRQAAGAIEKDVRTPILYLTMERDGTQCFTRAHVTLFSRDLEHIHTRRDEPFLLPCFCIS